MAHRQVRDTEWECGKGLINFARSLSGDLKTVERKIHTLNPRYQKLFNNITSNASFTEELLAFQRYMGRQVKENKIHYDYID